jgi:general secretion pathway protein D
MRLFLIASLLCLTSVPWPVAKAQTPPAPTPEQKGDESAATNAPAVPPVEAETPAAPVPAPVPRAMGRPVARVPAQPPVTTPAPATPTTPPPVAPPVPAAPRTVGVIDFQGTPVQAVLDYYSRELAKRSIISAPNLAGTIWFRSQTDLTIDEAKQALDTVLAMNGIAIIPMGEKFMKVVQIATAKQEGLPFAGEGKSQPAADTLMTQVIPLKYAEPPDVVAALQPFLHAYGQLIPFPKSGCILICETAANVNQMLEIIKVVDVPSALRMETIVIVVEHAKASEVVTRLQAIIQETQQAGGRPSAAATPTPTPAPVQPGGLRLPVARAAGAATTSGGGAAEDSVVEGKVVLTADERTNKIFILSRPSNFPFFEKIIAELDAKVEPDVIMKVISLQYATAEDAASEVNALISGGSPTFTSRRSTSSTSSSGARTTTAAPPPPVAASVGGGANAADTGFLQFAQGVRILPDPRTNSLLVMATKEDMLRIEELIRNVDTAVSQVQIEVIIAEVTLNNELDVGVNIFKRLFDEGQVSQTGGSGTGPTPPLQLPKASDLSSELISNLPAAAAFAGSGGLTYFATFQNLKLDAVIHALATTAKGKVLSTPVIQTMDNQEANILVGESVPVPVSTVSSVVGNTGTLATGQLNSNIEYKDAAIELTVTPRINPNGYVRMDIQQKVNDFGASVQVNGTSIPTITKREAKSSVAVQDGSTIVLGGLIKENKTVSETKVPFLGDIPFFGQVFKSKTSNKIRNELIIFIRPTVMRNDAEAVAAARRRSRLLKAGEELELEKRFASPEAGAQSSALTNKPPVAVGDRQAAKEKALEEQVGEPGN